MKLAGIDWVVIIAYFVVALGVGLYFSRRAGKNITEFFVSGRSLPWWIAGTSMVATTFAADTPLAVTGLVAEHGLAGNWFWWAMAFGGMFTVFVFSRLWRRSEVITDAEIVELRYSGTPAAFLRGFRAVYFAIPINAVIVGWVTMAMVKVLKHTVLAGVADAEDSNLDWYIIGGMLAVVAAYSVLSGMWGVAITDFIQFILAMTGCIVLAFLAVDRVGGIDVMQQQVNAAFGREGAFSFFPTFTGDNPIMPLEVFLIFLFVTWWATWYPGAEPGGGGYVVQRMAACKDERHSLLATLWFQVAHYCVRPWPWLITAFCAIAMFPHLAGTDAGDVGFPQVMTAVLPAGWRGLMLVAFFAAFMSTLSTQINWGASYLVSDVYKRFLRQDAGDRELAWASRGATVLVLLCGGIAAWIMVEQNVSVDAAWKFLAALGAGTGAVYMLRWFWWRINAWSEIVGMLAALVYFVIVSTVVGALDRVISYVNANVEILNENMSSLAIDHTIPWKPLLMANHTGITDAHIMAIVAFLTVITWIIATFLTRPADDATLDSFYRKVRPGGPGWKPVAARNPDVTPDKGLGISILCALLGAGIIFFTLPGVGMIIFGRYLEGLGCLIGAAACASAIVMLLNRTGWERVAR